MIARSQLFHTALDECRHRLKTQPDDQVLVSIEKQLEFLVDFEEGRTANYSRFNDLNLGLLAAREIEPQDMGFANLLYDVTQAVEDIKFKRK